MKKCISVTMVLGLVLALAPAANAGLVAYEGFDYTAANLNGQAGGTGLAGSWRGGGNATFESGSLSYTDGTRTLVTAGNSYRTSSGNRHLRDLDLAVGGAFDLAGLRNSAGNVGADGTTVYSSFMIQTNNANSFFWGSEYHRDADGDGNRDFQVGIENPSSTYGARSQNNNSWSKPFGPAADTNTHLYIVKFEFAAGNDTVSVYRDPADLATEPGSPDISFTPAESQDQSFDRIGVGDYVNYSAARFDEFRIGTTWADVTPHTGGAVIPEPMTMLAVGLGITGLGGYIRKRRRA